MQQAALYTLSMAASRPLMSRPLMRRRRTRQRSSKRAQGGEQAAVPQRAHDARALLSYTEDPDAQEACSECWLPASLMQPPAAQATDQPPCASKHCSVPQYCSVLQHNPSTSNPADIHLLATSLPACARGREGRGAREAPGVARKARDEWRLRPAPPRPRRCIAPAAAGRDKPLWRMGCSMI